MGLPRLCQRICVSLLQIKSIYPLAIIHVVGNVLTNVSLGKVAVSFTHTVKVSHYLLCAVFPAQHFPFPLACYIVGCMLSGCTQSS